jgi:low affinity Fe/Cu permease
LLEPISLAKYTQNNPMQRLYRHTETIFEKVTSFATIVLGNSLTFIAALGLVVYFLTNKAFCEQDMQHCIRDIIHGIAFLTLFVIQKEFNRFAASLHLKINELVIANESARNSVINVEAKTEHEITELAKEYTVIAVLANEHEVPPPPLIEKAKEAELPVLAHHEEIEEPQSLSEPHS